MSSSPTLSAARPASFALRFFAALSLLVSVGLGGCESDTSTSSSTPPSAAALMAADCTAFSNAGTVDVCHSTNDPAAPYAALEVSTASCKADHSDHAADFVDSDGSGCALQAARAPGGSTCKVAGQACSPAKAAECCSLACLCPLGAKRCTCG